MLSFAPFSSRTRGARAMVRPRFAIIADGLLVTSMTSGALFAQAPRESAECQVGSARLSLEYGCPPWNEQRRAQLDHGVPIGGLWRLGADDRTTLVIADGAIRLGDVVVEA